MEWQPIETYEPPHWVLVYYAGGEMIDTVSIAYHCGDGSWIDWDGDMYGAPSHWMKLPAAPIK